MARTDAPAAPVESIAPVEAPVAVPKSEEAHRSMLDRMTKKFANEKRVPVKARHDGDVFVQVNGYSFLIKPNVKVEVPESIVPILEEAGYI